MFHFITHMLTRTHTHTHTHTLSLSVSLSHTHTYTHTHTHTHTHTSIHADNALSHYLRNCTRDGSVLPSLTSTAHLPTPRLMMLPPLMWPVGVRVGGQVACVPVSVFVRMCSSLARTISPLASRPMTRLSSMEDIQHLIVQVSNVCRRGVRGGRGEVQSDVTAVYS